MMEAAGQGWGEDVSTLKVNEVNDWMRAWMFMERGGFKAGEVLGDNLVDDDSDDFSQGTN